MSIRWEDPQPGTTVPDTTTKPPASSPRAKRLGKLAAVSVVVLILSFAAYFAYERWSSDGFVAMGRNYPSLNREWGKAWLDGAKLLEAGQPVETALGTVGKSFEDRRQSLLAKIATPAFSKIVPEGKPEKDITPEDRKALAKAWEEFGEGLGK